MSAVSLVGTAILIVAVAAFTFLRQFDVKKLAKVALGASLVAAVFIPSVALAAKAKPVNQAALRLKAASATGLVGGSVLVQAKGGSGSGVVRFHVQGKGCAIGAKSGVLTSSDASACVVRATKAASGRYKTATSTALVIRFLAIGGPDSPSYATPDKASLVTTSWGSTGLAGSGPANDSVNGRTWFINAYYSSSDKWYYAYAAPGATVTLTWVVTGSNGQLLPNTPVTLQTQFAPGANNGKGDTDATFTSPSMVNGNISGVTNGLGQVTFTFTNTNGSANSAPVGWNSQAVSGAPNIAPGTTVADVAAETLESGSGYSWTRMVLQIGTDTFTANPADPTVNQATDLVDIIVATNLN